MDDNTRTLSKNKIRDLWSYLGGVDPLQGTSLRPTPSGCVLSKSKICMLSRITNHATLGLSFECAHKQIFHINILFPDVADGLVRKGCGMHISWRTKFRCNVQTFFAIPLMLIDNLLPQL